MIHLRKSPISEQDLLAEVNARVHRGRLARMLALGVLGAVLLPLVLFLMIQAVTYGLTLLLWATLRGADWGRVLLYVVVGVVGFVWGLWLEDKL